MKFKCIVMDPPYSFKDKLEMSDVRRSAESNYNVLSMQELENLKLQDVTDVGAVLSLWVPSSLLQEGLNIMKAYGFKQKQTYIWVKSKIEPFEDLVSSFNSFYKDEVKNKLKDISDFKKIFKDSSYLKKNNCKKF